MDHLCIEFRRENSSYFGLQLKSYSVKIMLKPLYQNFATQTTTLGLRVEINTVKYLPDSYIFRIFM